jgi:hypothetical protein
LDYTKKMVIPLRRRARIMRQRQDFYTLCPGCETKVELTLATKLQAARAGCSCICKSCNHEWVCIQEWIYRVEPFDHSQPVIAPNEHSPVPTQSSQPQTGGVLQSPTTVTAAPPPRRHLPTFQPPQPIAPPAHQQQAPLASNTPEPVEQPIAQRVPAPHAWSWERKTEQQSAPPQNHQSGFGH